MTLFLAALLFVFLAVGVIFIPCVLVILPPAALLRFRQPKLAALASICISAGLYYDHVQNWDSISYPHWVFGWLEEFYTLTFGASILMLLFVIKVILEPWSNRL